MCANRNWSLPGFANLTRVDAVHALIQRDIDRVNRGIGPHASIIRFALLETEGISVHDAEMTPNIAGYAARWCLTNRSLVDSLLAGPTD